MFRSSLLVLVASVVFCGSAHAQSPQVTTDTPIRIGVEPKPAAVENSSIEPPKAPAGFWDTLKVSGHIEAGATLQPDEPNNRLNFGHLFTDRANELLLNQALVTVERPADPKASGLDFGFRLQAMYGADARYTRLSGQFDDTTGGRNAFDLVEANVQAHLPLLFKGGVDVRAGEYASPLGAEVIDAAGNTFYSHSYIFNFGVPFKHAGVLSTSHVSSLVDIYAGLDTGVNTSLESDNNGGLSGLFGFGLNFEKVTVVALSHIGPENPRGSLGVRANSDLRYLNDVVINWKVSDKLTSTTELNYIRDDGFSAQGGGAAQYLTYALNPQVTLAGRAEIWRDDQGFFVAGFPRSNDALLSLEGRPYTSIGGGPATYGALTLGLSWKPVVPKLIEGFVVRPEVRYDYALDGRPFRDQMRKDQFTLGLDMIVPLSLAR